MGVCTSASDSTGVSAALVMGEFPRSTVAEVTTLKAAPENKDEAGSVGGEHHGGCLKNARKREGYWNIKMEIMRCRVKEEGNHGNRRFGSRRSFFKRDAKM